MESKLFSTEELEHRIAEIGEFPPIGTQWWEMPVGMIPAVVIDNRNGTSHLYLLHSEGDFNDRPFGGRLVSFPEDKADFQPQNKPRVPLAKKVPAVRRKAPYRNLAAIFG